MENNKLIKVFVDENEALISSLGYNNRTNSFESSALLLSEKRIYQIGEIDYSAGDSHFNESEGISITSLNEVSSVWDILHQNILFIIFGILFFVISLSIFLITRFIESSIPVLIIVSIFLLLVSLGCFVLYFLTKRKYLIIEYAGGKINFNSTEYSKEEIFKFQKAIFAQQDILKSNSIKS